MININKKLVLGVLLASLTLTTACNDILDEEPKGIYTPEDFYTERGIQQGVTALYRHLRLLYGNGYYMSTTMGGTDELTYAQSADNNFKDLDFSGVGNLTPSSFPSSMVWAAVFPYINTANGIIQNGPTVGIKESLISEARFFRAFDYFLLVQTYGGVPLDLGSGDLKFNISASTSSKRNTVSEVYTKAIFPDLLTAIDNLPISPRVTGGVTKNVARLYLAKAYLTYAWWLQNPNNIPTYPETSRTDPNGQSAQWYFQQAYDVALEAINNPGPLGLHHIFANEHHYGPEPWGDYPGARPDWTPVYYHKADANGLGFDRTMSGSNAVSQYNSPLKEIYNNINTTPENLLLWFHHVPWDYQMKNNKSMWDNLAYKYDKGVKGVITYQKIWDQVESYVDKERFFAVQSKLKIQAKDAFWWKDACLLYFQGFSKMPIPYDIERPIHELEDLKKIKLNMKHHN
ncbi:RagB/SusD family nutrient uptake outer membrane protein [Soonwooa purpurea]